MVPELDRRSDSRGSQAISRVSNPHPDAPQDAEDEASSQPAFRRNFLSSSRLNWSAGASGAAALLTCCALHPFDLIKTRMQAATTGGAIPQYRSTFSALCRIFEQEGMRGLWKGVGVTAAASCVSWTCFRYAFDSFSLSFPAWRRDVFGQPQVSRGEEKLLLDDVASGFLAGVLVTVLTHPLWLAKARMEMQAREAELAGWPQFRNGFDCIVAAARGGLKESYRGIGPAIALAPHAAIQMAVYERLKRNHADQSPSNVPTGLPALWGATSKFAALSLTYPLQVLRSRQQVHNMPHEGLNFLQLGIRMVREEGVLSLFGGYWVHTQRACLQTGIMFLIYERILSKSQ